MKQFFRLCLIPLTAVCLLAPQPAHAADAARHTISVSGHAEASVTPDVAVAVFGVQTADSDVETAKRDNDRLMQRIHEAMLVTGIDRSKLQTAVFSIQPLYADNKGGSEIITGYRVQNTISVTIEDLRNVSRVIDAAFAAGANQFQSIRFGVKKEQNLRDELLKQALLDGRQKALLMAETLGEKLGRPVSVSESGHIAPVMMDNIRLKSMQYASSTPIAAGSLTASADVQLVFELLEGE